MAGQFFFESADEAMRRVRVTTANEVLFLLRQLISSLTKGVGLLFNRRTVPPRQRDNHIPVPSFVLHGAPQHFAVKIFSTRFRALRFSMVRRSMPAREIGPSGECALSDIGN